MDRRREHDELHALSVLNRILDEMLADRDEHRIRQAQRRIFRPDDRQRVARIQDYQRRQPTSPMRRDRR
jgi:hypothetical protein